MNSLDLQAYENMQNHSGSKTQTQNIINICPVIGGFEVEVKVEYGDGCIFQLNLKMSMVQVVYCFKGDFFCTLL